MPLVFPIRRQRNEPYSGECCKQHSREALAVRQMRVRVQKIRWHLLENALPAYALRLWRDDACLTQNGCFRQSRSRPLESLNEQREFSDCYASPKPQGRGRAVDQTPLPTSFASRRLNSFSRIFSRLSYFFKCRARANFNFIHAP